MSNQPCPVVAQRGPTGGLWGSRVGGWGDTYALMCSVSRQDTPTTETNYDKFFGCADAWGDFGRDEKRPGNLSASGPLQKGETPRPGAF